MQHDQATPGGPTQPVGLGHKSARGVAYLMSGTVAAKVVNVVAQVALAWLLSEDDFGVFAMAFTVIAFSQVLDQAGISDVLVHRKRFRLWAVPGIWFALALGGISCLIVLASAPIAAAVYGNDQVFWMLLILSTASIPNALMVLPRVQMTRQLRFRGLAALNLGVLTARMTLTVLLAAAGFGPYSFAIPMPIVQAAAAAFMWWWVRPPWSFSPHFRRWRYLVAHSSQSLGSGLLAFATDQMDYILVGIFKTAQVLGIYYFAYRMAAQMVQILTINLTQTLFPVLTHLNRTPTAQFQAFLKAQRVLAMVGIGGCLIQAAATEPLARLIFPPKWEPSIVLMQILSLGMATRMVAGSSFALLKSQGRFRTMFVIRVIYTLLLLASLLAVLLPGGGVLTVSIVVALLSSLLGPVVLYESIRPYDAGWTQVAEVLVRPTLCGLVAAGSGWLLGLQLKQAGFGDAVQLAIILLVSVALNVLLAWVWMRPTWDEFWTRVWRLLPERLRNAV